MWLCPSVPPPQVVLVCRATCQQAFRPPRMVVVVGNGSLPRERPVLAGM